MATYDGVAAPELARRLGVPQVIAYDSVSSTLDVAHTLGAEGAPAGTVVLADEQTAGRGRFGRTWRSHPGRGIWLTLVERPSADALAVLALRLGMYAAAVLDDFAGERVRLKWPNDLYLSRGKLAGILAEARWRDRAVDWVAVGFGLNVLAPEGVSGAALLAGTSRVAVLERLVPALRAAAVCRGGLSDEERAVFAARDLAQGRRCLEPVAGRVLGVDADGALLVETTRGRERVRAGSLALEGEA